MENLARYSTILLMACFLFAGCCSAVNSKEKTQEQKHIVSHGEFTIVQLYAGYRLVEYDGHQYLTQHRGGIVHLENCKGLHK